MVSDNYYSYVGAWLSTCTTWRPSCASGSPNLKPELKIGYAS